MTAGVNPREQRIVVDMTGNHHDRRIELAVRVEWPNGARVVAERLPGEVGLREDTWPDTPLSRAWLLAQLDAQQPLNLTEGKVLREGPRSERLFAQRAARGLLLLAISLHALVSPAPAQDLLDSQPASAPATTQPYSLPQLVDRVRRSVVTVLTYDAEGRPCSQGSGFFYRAGIVVTADHVILGASRAEVRLYSGRVFPVGGVVGRLVELDLAALEVDFSLPGDTTGLSGFFAEIDQYEEKSEIVGPALHRVGSATKVGDRVIVISSPRGLDLSVSEGIISGIRDLPGSRRLLQTTAAMSSGSSGGPVLNLYGEVVGVARCQLTDGQALNFAIPAENLSRLTLGKVKPLVACVTASKIKASQQYRRGVDYALDLKYERALDCLLESVRIDPSGEAWLWIARCRERRRQFDDAVAAYREAIRLSPERADYHSSLADLQLRLGRRTEYESEMTSAVACHEAEIKRAPDDYFTHYSLGVCLKKLDRNDDASRAFREAIRLSPSFFPAHNDLGVTLQAQGRTIEAISAFQAAIRAAPDFVTAHTNLGAALAQLQRNDEAVDAFKRALKLDPADPVAHFDLGLLYVISRDIPAAIGEYRVLKELDPERADRLFNMIYP